MSGYCPDCGNTQCICKEVERQENAPSSCTVDSIVVPRVLWERTVCVIETIYNSRRGSCGAIENVYCPGPMNRHGIDNLWNEIQRHNSRNWLTALLNPGAPFKERLP